jgi:hypothetical protein
MQGLRWRLHGAERGVDAGNILSVAAPGPAR